MVQADISVEDPETYEWKSVTLDQEEARALFGGGAGGSGQLESIGQGWLTNSQECQEHSYPVTISFGFTQKNSRGELSEHRETV